MKLTRTSLLFVFALISLTAAAQAGVILSPIAAIRNDFGEFPGYPISRTFDQSGLSSGFVSGVTDFGTYIASDPRHDYSPGFEWFGDDSSVEFGFVDYDLGASYSITSIALWNEDGAGIAYFTAATSNDSSFGVSTDLGLFNVTDNSPFADYPAQVFDLTPSVGRYVRLGIAPLFTQYWDSASMGEIAFEVGPARETPEPGIVFLLGAGLSGLYFSRRRRS